MSVRERDQQGTGDQLIGEDVSPTLQLNGYVASKPTNIRIMEMRAVRRQLEYSFAPVDDQVATRV